MNLGPSEIVVILLIALLVFGPSKLPEVGRQVGAAMRELRQVQARVRAEINSAIAEPAPSYPASRSIAEEAKAANREPDVDHPDTPVELPPAASSPDAVPHDPAPPDPDGRSFL